ncbi:MAG: potassium channel family protein [Actinobacteria bacterium]|nr:potassium channel family protein [Actinomycetota bacterium]
MGAKNLADLTRKELRIEMLKSTLVVLAFCMCAVGVFFLIPFDGMTSNSQAVLRLVVGIVFLILVIALLFRRIMTAPLPQLKAMEALVVVLVKFICLFAGTYLAMSHMHSDSFTEPLTHTSALYFAVVTFGTVGYGDLTAHSDFARMLVSAQIILDFIFIAALIRAFVAVAQLSLQKSQDN